jgi:2-polyprenyl-6-hydroxyphenyl methylase/3-demethylubiquinone-9 3-methyltransferase
VAPGGALVIALYHRTPSCGFWRVEKRFYSRAPRWVQSVIQLAYKTAFLSYLTIRGRNPVAFLRDYGRERGMDWYHDVHDWLGGYPYESTRRTEVEPRLKSLDFSMERVFERNPGRLALFSTGCDEYVARRGLAA